MKLFINNFRGVAKAEYTFKDGSLILINGPSGIGKSTIFNAITWCIYGQLRNVDPHGTKGKVSVTLEVGPLVITRKKNPGLLKVLVNGKKELEDDVAQCEIDNYFKGADLWNIIAYIPQGERNALLTSTNSNKMDILRQLAFPNSNPEKEVERVDSYLKKESLALESKKAALQALANQRANYETSNIEYSEELLKAIDKNLEQLKTRIIIARDKHVNNEKKRAILHSLKEQEKSLREELNNIKVVEEEEIKKLEDQIVELRNADAALELKRKLDRSRDLLKPLETEEKVMQYVDLEITDKIIRDTERQEEKYEKYKEICESVDCELNKESIDEAIEQLEAMLEIQPKLINKEKADKLKKELKSIELIDCPYKIKELEEKLYNAKARSKLHICPNCTISLIFDGSTIKTSKDKPSTDKEIKELQEQIELAYESRERKRKYNEIVNKIEELEVDDSVKGPLLKEGQIKTCKNKIMMLKSVDLYEAPKVSSDILKKVKKYKAIKEEVDELEMRFRPYETLDINLKAANIKELERKVALYRSDRVKKSEKEKLLKEVVKKCDIKVEEGLFEEISKLEKEQDELTNKKEKMKMAKQFKEIDSEFNKVKGEVEVLNKRYVTLEKLKTKVILAQNYMLEETVRQINTSLRDVANNLFSEPITIVLELFKRVKTTQQLKSQVNFVINYKGNEYTSLDSLSGGEADRVSLAFSIALNAISDSPFLLLDECMASLDQDIREQCLESLRSIGKTVIAINHDGVEGNYDDVVRL